MCAIPFAYMPSFTLFLCLSLLFNIRKCYFLWEVNDNLPFLLHFQDTNMEIVIWGTNMKYLNRCFGDKDVLKSSHWPQNISSLVWELIIITIMAQTVKNLPAMRETPVQILDWEDPLEKEMAIHSSIFAWKIPWPEELQSIALHSQTQQLQMIHLINQVTSTLVKIW